MSCLDFNTAPFHPSTTMSSKRAHRSHQLQWQSLSSLSMPPSALAGTASSLISQNPHSHPHSHSIHPNSHPQHSHHSSHSSHHRQPPRLSMMPHHHPHLTPASPASSLPSANPFSSSTHPTRSVTEIIPRLFISDLSFAENPACLASNHITHVLSALSESVYIPSAQLLHPHPPPARLHVRVEDFPFAELAAHLPKTTAWITDALARDPNARVLVHCVEGISRSVSVVAAYLMSQYGMSPPDAVKYIKSKRVVAEPNFGFVQQLHEYARDSLGRKS